jgi:hypothetical protein
VPASQVGSVVFFQQRRSPAPVAIHKSGDLDNRKQTTNGR